MTKEEWLERFSDKLLTEMYEAKMTQQDLAEQSGLTKGTISNYINKRQTPTARALVNIAYVFNCPVDGLADFGEMID